MPQDHASPDRFRLGSLFAERHIYLRSGLRSSYVVISRRLQVSVALASLLLLGWLALASYSAIANHLETVEQERRLARLETTNRDLQAAVEKAGGDQETRAARIRELEAALAEARAGAQGANALDQELAQAHKRIAELEQVVVAGDEQPVATAGDGKQAVGSAAGGNQLQAARSQVAELESPTVSAVPALSQAASAVSALESDLDAAKRSVAALGVADRQAADGALQDVDQQLAVAGGRLATLETALEQLKAREAALELAVNALAPSPPPPAPR